MAGRLAETLCVCVGGPEAHSSPFSDRRSLITRFLLGLGSCREGGHLLPLSRVLQENPLHRFPQLTGLVIVTSFS